MKSEELEDLRKKINSIDDEILQLLSNRSKIVLKIGKHKKEQNVIDLDREQKILVRYDRVCDQTRFKRHCCV